jgi:hypothetical protein
VDDNILTNGQFAGIVTAAINDPNLLSKLNLRELATTQAILSVVCDSIDIELKKRAKCIVRIIK